MRARLNCLYLIVKLFRSKVFVASISAKSKKTTAGVYYIFGGQQKAANARA